MRKIGKNTQNKEQDLVRERKKKREKYPSQIKLRN